ncbi:hypothetical protein FWK35_00013479 [Aphis craccivora]|uniref:Uncharacterized protein n=1 Tax=Aphis craccivora TaxID=307492 RepID=A0A6G0ZFW2_APHCR|nr:hypothetical protein FWK35_00013479 [Aphis craccivora]
MYMLNKLCVNKDTTTRHYICVYAIRYPKCKSKLFEKKKTITTYFKTLLDSDRCDENIDFTMMWFLMANSNPL